MNWKRHQSAVIFLTCLAVQACLGAQRLDARQLLQQAMMRKQRDLTSDNDAEYSEAASRYRRDDVKIPLTEINEVMSLDDDTTLDVRKTVTTAQGIQLIKMQELYKGRAVSDGVVTVETDEDGHHVIDASGNVYKNIDVSFDDKGELDSDGALDVCVKHNNDQHLRDSITHIKVEPEVFFNDNGNGYPAYLVQYLVLSETEGRRPTCIVDARDARVTMSWDALDTCTDCDATGMGGNEKIGKIRYGELQRCLDLRKENDVCYLENKYVRVFNNNFSSFEQSNNSEVASYNCKEIDDEVNGAYSPLLDALFYGTVVGRMFEDWYNMTPLDDKITFRVHYGFLVSNAFWNGFACLFGDGGDMFHPLVSLDIAAHEVGHGVTEKNSGLFYFDQSGGINEAFSDMMGETAEAYLDNADWVSGFDIVKKTFSPLRYFENPEKDNYSISHADNFTAYMDVHFSSGVFNKVFFLLVHEYEQPIKEVFHVFLHANMMYWHHMSDFKTAACDVMKAAYDLGQDGNMFWPAFSQVGIEVCDIEDHVLQVRSGKKYTNIIVSRDISPKFRFMVPAPFDMKVRVKASSRHGDVHIVLSNATWAEDTESVIVYAKGLGVAEFYIPIESPDTHISITLSTRSVNSLNDVTLQATHICIYNFTDEEWAKVKAFCGTKDTDSDEDKDKDNGDDNNESEDTDKEKESNEESESTIEGHNKDDKEETTHFLSGHMFNFFHSFVLMIFPQKE